jgi:hypothetical protein
MNTNDNELYLCEANLIANGPIDALVEFAEFLTTLNIISQSRVEERALGRLRFTFKGASSQPFRIVEQLASRGRSLMLEGILRVAFEPCPNVGVDDFYWVNALPRGVSAGGVNIWRYCWKEPSPPRSPYTMDEHIELVEAGKPVPKEGPEKLAEYHREYEAQHLLNWSCDELCTARPPAADYPDAYELRDAVEAAGGGEAGELAVPLGGGGDTLRVHSSWASYHGMRLSPSNRKNSQLGNGPAASEGQALNTEVQQ